MPRPRAPRRGSKSFSPRRRASNINAHIKHWPNFFGSPQLLGFAGYKAGMTHLYQIEDRPNHPESGLEVKTAATIIDTPPMLICAMRVYSENYDGLRASSESWMKEVPKDILKNVNIIGDSSGSKLTKIDDIKNKIVEVRVIVSTQPKLSSLEKNTPDLIEIKIGGGDIEQQIEYAKNLIGKTISAGDVFKPGESIDLAAVTKGKGFQGPVKRWGIRIQQNKSRKTIRGVAAINPASPRTIHPHVARAGQMGTHHRIDLNKRIVMIGGDGERVSPNGGFNRYGQIKGDYVVIKGSVQGPPKRLIRMRKSVREAKYPTSTPQITFLNTEWKKESNVQ